MFTGCSAAHKGTTDFWMKHCGVIPLVNVDSKGNQVSRVLLSNQIFAPH